MIAGPSSGGGGGGSERARAGGAARRGRPAPAMAESEMRGALH